MQAWVYVANLVRPTAFSGRLLAQSVAGLPFLLTPGLEVALVPPHHDSPRFARVQSIHDNLTDFWEVGFEGVSKRDGAHLLRGLRCLARKDDLPFDIISAEQESVRGYAVFEAERGLIGTVCDILKNPGQDLLVVKRPDSSLAYIPFVDALVTRVDAAQCRLDVSLPPGLLDL